MKPYQAVNRILNKEFFEGNYDKKSAERSLSDVQTKLTVRRRFLKQAKHTVENWHEVATGEIRVRPKIGINLYPCRLIISR